MVFASGIFLFIFLPITILGDRLLRNANTKLKNIFLLLMSTFFYLESGVIPFFLLVLSIIINYVSARAIVYFRKRKGLILLFALVYNIGMLFIFKYLSFLLGEVGILFGWGLPKELLNIALPLGISFYTFQALSYVIDVYNDVGLVEYSIVNVALYISFFPQLVAGPIVRWDGIRTYLASKIRGGVDYSNVFKYFVIGLGKKVIISNQMAGEFIEALGHRGINCADLRRSVMKDDTLYTEYFFKYEHHMVPKAGLAAAKEISKCIDDIMDTSEDASIFDIGNYSFTEYIQNKGLMNDRLLVYEGKESMDLFHPLYETDFVKYVADYGLTITGTFDEVMYALWELPAYNTWNHGIKAVKTYRNRMIDGKQPKILLLTDSYSDVISPFLSCAYADIDEIDLRIFNGSLQKYIEETEPDLVVSIYSAYDFNSRGAESLFDFR